MKALTPIRILCFLDTDSGRDVEILLPVIYVAEKYFDCNVEYAFIWDIHAIYRKRPDIVLLPNTIGSVKHYLVAKYAYENGIKVFATVSEGNFRTDGTFDYWGYNKDKNFFQEYICLWSERTHHFLAGVEPDFAAKMVLTGGTGFDRYKIYRFPDKREFLTHYNRPEFKKIVGYAGWAFGKVFNQQGREELIANGHPEERFKWIEEQMYLIEEILRRAIENNPDILFVLKRHPNEANPSITEHGMNEMVRLAEYPNVLYLRQNEPIHDIISVSDLWTGFETTTAIETWLMGRTPTLLINPDPDFNRDKLYKGSLVLGNYDDFQSCISEFYRDGKISDFDRGDLADSRKQLIKDTIGFGDGLNHLRTAFYLKKGVDNTSPGNTRVKLSLKFLIMYLLMEFGKYFYNKFVFTKLPKFKKTTWIFDNFRLKKLPGIRQRHWKYMDEYYTKKKLSEIFSDGTQFQKFMNN
ncbi:MAG TPA: hypothetical protein ENI20_14050 [Bacteroides sp.]|nr:hypothetical protein [Bacteroides sp.]